MPMILFRSQDIESASCKCGIFQKNKCYHYFEKLDVYVEILRFRSSSIAACVLMFILSKSSWVRCQRRRASFLGQFASTWRDSIHPCQVSGRTSTTRKPTFVDVSTRNSKRVVYLWNTTLKRRIESDVAKKSLVFLICVPAVAVFGIDSKTQP